MDRLREEFLARAAFAEDEHRGVGTGEPLHKAHDLFHLAAFEDGDEFAGLFAGKEGETVVELLNEFLLAVISSCSWVRTVMSRARSRQGTTGPCR